MKSLSLLLLILIIFSVSGWSSSSEDLVTCNLRELSLHNQQCLVLAENNKVIVVLPIQQGISILDLQRLIDTLLQINFNLEGSLVVTKVKSVSIAYLASTNQCLLLEIIPDLLKLRERHLNLTHKLITKECDKLSKFISLN